jgi:hypothetical protein
MAGKAMTTDDFQRFLEMGLSIDDAPRPVDSLQEREALAWRLSESEGPLGKVLLGDLLLGQKVSYLRRDISALPFGRTLVAENFPVLAAQTDKNHWHWYYLGICHESGRGTPVDHAKAEEAFAMAHRLGNDVAGFEEIWAAYLRGASAMETVMRLRNYQGLVKPFARVSAKAIALLALGPVREIGSAEHVFRILELSGLLHEYFYHSAGARHIHVQTEAEMRQDLPPLKNLHTATAAVTLWLIARNSRRNPTGANPEEWLRQAIAPDNTSLAALIRQRVLDKEELDLVADLCDQHGWTDSALDRAVKATLAAIEAEADED